MTTNSENNKSFAETLHEESSSIVNELTTLNAISIREQVKLLAQQISKQGRFELRLNLTGKGWSEKALQEAIRDLITLDKFSVEAKSEVTAWYSNTDWDNEDFLYVRW